MSRNIKSHFQYSWWKYLAALAAAIVLWNGLFTALAKPEDNEKLTVACFDPKVDVKALQARLETDQKTFTRQPLKKLTVDAYLDYENSSVYFSYALASADVFIFSEDMVTPDENGNVPVTYKALFEPIPMERFSDILGDQSPKLFADGSDVYGVYIRGEGRLADVFGENRACVLFFNPESVNLSRLYGNGNTEDGAALDLVLYLLKMENTNGS